MIYLALQILLFLVLSVALGFVIGWWLKTAFFRNQLTEDTVKVNGLRAELSHARQRHDTQHAELSQLRNQLAGAQRAGETQQGEIAQLREAVADAQLSQPGVDAQQHSELVRLREELERARQETAARDSELERMREQRDAPQVPSGGSTLAQVREQLMASQQECAACQQEVQGLRAQLAELGGGGQKPELLSSPTTPPDDLKMISGVGQKLEKTLNELGIYYFEQIAGFTPENVAWVDERLRFKGRIQRERWIEQARQLAAGEDTKFSARYKNGN